MSPEGSLAKVRNGAEKEKEMKAMLPEREIRADRGESEEPDVFPVLQVPAFWEISTAGSSYSSLTIFTDF